MRFDNVENFFSVEIVVIGIFHDVADLVVVIEELFESAFVLFLGMYHKGIGIDFDVQLSHTADAPHVDQIQCRHDIPDRLGQMVFDAQRDFVILNIPAFSSFMAVNNAFHSPFSLYF